MQFPFLLVALKGRAVPPAQASPPPPLVDAAPGQEGRRHITNAPELMRAYLANIQHPTAFAALFAEDGVPELPQMKCARSKD